MKNSTYIKRLIAQSLEEDLGTGDITTASVVPAGTMVSGSFIARQQGIICGTDIAAMVFLTLDPSIKMEIAVSDGHKVNPGDEIAHISGPAPGILSGERLALNFMQRLSGIATNTAFFVSQVAGTSTKIVDTRKTTPGLRVLEKYAVKTGGGGNHRMNLSDGVLIKDNHIKAAGGIRQAVEAARKNAPKTLKIEVETETLDQVDQALEAGADIIMLDNMAIETMRKAVEKIGGRALTEASGNMDSKNLSAVAATGVDMISVGALTHSVKALDISLKLH